MATTSRIGAGLTISCDPPSAAAVRPHTVSILQAGCMTACRWRTCRTAAVCLGDSAAVVAAEPLPSAAVDSVLRAGGRLVMVAT